MTLTEARDLTSLDRRIQAVERLIPVKFPDATDEQFAHFREEMKAAETTADKLEVALWWVSWMAAL